MTHWPFILGAYAVTILGTAGLALWSLLAMRTAEREASELDR